MEILESLGCKKIIIEQVEDEVTRPQWKRMLTQLKKSDELVVLGLSNAIRGLRELAAFFELCRIKKIRLISLKDKLDSNDELFPASTSKFMDVFASLMGDIAVERGASARIRAQNRGNALGRPVGSRDKQREKLCIELYMGGSNVEDILKETGFRSKSSVFRILRNNGMEPDRRPGKKKKAD
jgi:Site-specific recombinases, DNA invertase Pin homologs